MNEIAMHTNMITGKRFSSGLVGVLCLLLLVSRALGQVSLFDASFGIGAGTDGPVNSLIVQGDGTILVGGEFLTVNDQTNAYLARLLPNGTLDPSVNLSADGPVHQLALQSDGKALVAGSFTNLQGVNRRGIARLLTSGVIDLGFDASAALGSDETVFTVSLQSDGKILAATGFNPDYVCRVFRLLSSGQTDPEFVNTNIFSDYVFTFVVGTNGTILVGGKFQGVNGVLRPGLTLLNTNGAIDASFNSELGSSPSIFSMAVQTNGGVLVGGNFIRQGLARSVLGRMNPAFQWDTNFATDSFDSGWLLSTVNVVLPQADGSLVVGGNFFEVGGYGRRHLARLDSQGHVDSCFDPGLGLGGFSEARTLAQQGDGRILVGGQFQGVDGNERPSNLARVLPEGECGAIRVYLIRDAGQLAFVVGQFPPGGTNYLQMSTNLVQWQTIDTRTGYYVYWPFDDVDRPAAFFRVKKEY